MGRNPDHHLVLLILMTSHVFLFCCVSGDSVLVMQRVFVCDSRPGSGSTQSERMCTKSAGSWLAPQQLVSSGMVEDGFPGIKEHTLRRYVKVMKRSDVNWNVFHPLTHLLQIYTARTVLLVSGRQPSGCVGAAWWIPVSSCLKVLDPDQVWRIHLDFTRRLLVLTLSISSHYGAQSNLKPGLSLCWNTHQIHKYTLSMNPWLILTEDLCYSCWIKSIWSELPYICSKCMD